MPSSYFVHGASYLRLFCKKKSIFLDFRERDERADSSTDRRQQPFRVQAHLKLEGHWPLWRRRSLRSFGLAGNDAKWTFARTLRKLVCTKKLIVLYLKSCGNTYRGTRQEEINVLFAFKVYQKEICSFGLPSQVWRPHSKIRMIKTRLQSSKLTPLISKPANSRFCSKFNLLIV